MDSNLKIKRILLEQEKISYASDHIDLPEGGVDCSEGCNPYGFPAACTETLRNFDATRMGPYPHSQALYEAIAEYWADQIDVERENVILADGSINALYIINNIYDTRDALVLGISPQFTDYYMHAQMIGIEYDPYQLDKNKNYKFDYDEFVNLTRTDYNYIYIDNPNNPTGQMIDIETIGKIVARAESKNITIIVDEAYGDFMPKENSAVQLFSKYHNLVVVRTMSKGFGLAGLRVGYIIAHKDLIHCMNKMINPYMVGELAREVAATALRHGESIEDNKRDFAEMKRQIREVLGCADECPAGNTGHLHMAETLDTNSLLMLYHDNPYIKLKDEFYDRKVLVIDGNDFKGLDSTSARIRLPIMDEFPVLLDAIREINEI